MGFHDTPCAKPHVARCLCNKNLPSSPIVRSRGNGGDIGTKGLCEDWCADEFRGNTGCSLVACSGCAACGGTAEVVHHRQCEVEVVDHSPTAAYDHGDASQHHPLGVGYVALFVSGVVALPQIEL